jgi:hypothetical protein
MLVAGYSASFELGFEVCCALWRYNILKIKAISGKGWLLVVLIHLRTIDNKHTTRGGSVTGPDFTWRINTGEYPVGI